MSTVQDFQCVKQYTQVKIIKQTDKRVILEALCKEQKKYCLIISTKITPRQQEDINQQLKYTKWDRLKHDNLMKRIQKPSIKKLNINGQQTLLLLDIYHLTRNNITKNYGRLLSLEEQVDMAAQLANLVDYIHGTGNFHGSIVSQNISIKGSRVKVFPPELSFYAKFGLEQKHPFYAAPQKQVCMATDIWNLGLTFFQIFRGQKLDNTSELFPCMDNNFPCEQELSDMRSKIAIMISGMLNKNPARRITIKQVQQYLKIILSQSASIMIPLLEQQRRLMKEQEDAISRRQQMKQLEFTRTGPPIQRRIVLTKHLLSLIYLSSTASITFRILFKIDAMEFMKITYSYNQLPEEIKKEWKTCYDLFTYLTRLTKKQIHFLSNGVLEIIPPKINGK